MIEFNRYALQQVIRSLAAGVLATVASYYLPSSQYYWILLTALLFVQIRVGDFFSQQLFFQLISGVLLAVLMLLAARCENLVLLAVFLAATSFMSVYVGARQENIFLPVNLLNFMVLLSAGMPSAFDIAIVRSEYVLVGVAIAMLATALLWPSTKRFESNYALTICLQTFKELIRTIFAIYLQRDYKAEHLAYEKHIYQLSQRFFFYRLRLRKLTCEANEIFEIIMALSALRYQVKDHSTFEIAQQEFSDIAVALLDVMSLQKKFPDDYLEVSIARLEEVYRSALQVTAYEPLVFLFFVYSLRALAFQLNCFLNDSEQKK